MVKIRTQDATGVGKVNNAKGKSSLVKNQLKASVVMWNKYKKVTLLVGSKDSKM